MYRKECFRVVIVTVAAIAACVYQRASMGSKGPENTGNFHRITAAASWENTVTADDWSIWPVIVRLDRTGLLIRFRSFANTDVGPTVGQEGEGLSS